MKMQSEDEASFLGSDGEDDDDEEDGDDEDVDLDWEADTEDHPVTKNG